MRPLNWQKELGREGHRVKFSGQPVAMHCHHYHINLQKTLEETLGKQGIRLLYQSAEEAIFENFTNILRQYKSIKTEKSKFEMAALVFQNSGMGIIRLQEVGPEGGLFMSPSNHHVTGWLAKHGMRDTPGCHFVRGWIAGILEAIYDRPLGYYAVEERQCKMMRKKECVFVVKVR
ncbi:MAG: hypothetical protein HN366_03880 [Deltaproteobacteria bacterium]|jgi:predicted hydrocarbon binding protein|nr:hypothetical protein [Deltaproteobacteria bacterium]